MISIVTPVLNGAKFIEKNIQSIQKLTIPFEHIIVDGGSADGTLDIIKKYPHLELLHQKEKTGMYGAIHQGFKDTKFDIITWVNCDDEILFHNFEIAICKLQKHNVDFVYGGVYYKNENQNNIIYRPPVLFSKFLLKKGVMSVAQSSTLYKKDFYFQCSGVNYNKFKLLGDLDLFQRFAHKPKSSFYRFNKPLSIFYLYKGSLLASNHQQYENEKKLIIYKPNKIIIIFYRVLLYPYYLRKLINYK